MPLKHRTETRLVIVLGLAMALAGFVMAVLPPLPAGFIPWAGAFIVTLVYPLLLYPLFRRDRADYVFRLLHWVPAGMLLLWLLLQMVSRYWPASLPVLAWYTWGFGFVPVALGILALINYCLDVVRQRVPRVPVLFLVWVLFAFGALRGSAMGESTERWLAAMFMQQPPIIADNSGSSASDVSQSSFSSKPIISSSLKTMSSSPKPASSSVRSSSRPSEVATASAISSKPRASAKSGASEAAVEASSSEERLSFWQWIIGSGDDQGDDDAAATSSRPTSVSLRSVSSRPSALPDSGFGWGAIALTLCGLYTATLHRKTKQRLA